MPIRTATTVFNPHGEPALTFFNLIQTPASAAAALYRLEADQREAASQAATR